MGSDEIILLVEAAQDIRNGGAFYEQRQDGLGAYFTQCILSDLESLKLYAGIHKRVSRSIYRLKSKRFPYAIYYRVKFQTTYVIAILPVRGKPLKVEARLSSSD